MPAALQQSVDEVVAATPGIEWSISIRDAVGVEVAGSDADRAMRTASVGKLLLLVEVARQRELGEISGETLLRRDSALAAADSGLWQHLRVQQLSVDDLCVLVAAVSDNLATNVVLKKVGLQSVRSLADSLGLAHTALLDYVRDRRGPDDPPNLSTGSASELSRLAGQLSRRELISTAVSEQVNAWLALGVDLSMVASAFGLDPLSHTRSGREMFLRNKTGADPGVKADIGMAGRNAAEYSYALIANWDASAADLDDVVLAGMNAVGAALMSATDSVHAAARDR